MTPMTSLVSQVERLLFLKTLPMQGVDPRTMGQMAANLTERTFAKGEVLLEGGRIPDRFFAVVEGEVEVVEGTGRTSGMGSRSLIGLTTILARDPRGYRLLDYVVNTRPGVVYLRKVDTDKDGEA